jgi:hypothetical protein
MQRAWTKDHSELVQAILRSSHKHQKGRWFGQAVDKVLEFLSLGVAGVPWAADLFKFTLKLDPQLCADVGLLPFHLCAEVGPLPLTQATIDRLEAAYRKVSSSTVSDLPSPFSSSCLRPSPQQARCSSLLMIAIGLVHGSTLVHVRMHEHRLERASAFLAWLRNTRDTDARLAEKIQEDPTNFEYHIYNLPCLERSRLRRVYQEIREKVPFETRRHFLLQWCDRFFSQLPAFQTIYFITCP